MDNRNIILVGFMGTGKSSTGRIVADRLRREFLDMDTLIEEREKRTIPEIFKAAGEPHFRKLERELVCELAARANLVIAPGGGIVLDPDNILDFSATGLVICLTATPEAILARVGKDANRPLLQSEDKLQRIRELLEKRKPLYDAIPNQLDSTGLSPAQVADKLLEHFYK